MQAVDDVGALTLDPLPCWRLPRNRCVPWGHLVAPDPVHISGDPESSGGVLSCTITRTARHSTHCPHLSERYRVVGQSTVFPPRNGE